MDKKSKSFLQKIFYEYKDNKARLQELLTVNYPLTLKSTNYEKVCATSSAKFTAEDKIVAAIDEADKLTRYITVVEYTLIKYKGEHKDKLIRYIYFDKFGAKKTARLLHIDERTLYRWKEEILLSAEFYAIELRIFAN